MDFNYTITLKGSKDTIEFKPEKGNHDGDTRNQGITGVQFGFKSNIDSCDRDKNGRTEIIIYGKLDDRPETFKAINGLAEWAKARRDVYREVTIVQTSDNQSSDGTGKFCRTYHFDSMFCVNYFEKSGSCVKNKNDASLEFELYLAQAPNYKISETLHEMVND